MRNPPLPFLLIFYNGYCPQNCLKIIVAANHYLVSWYLIYRKLSLFLLKLYTLMYGYDIQK